MHQFHTKSKKYNTEKTQYVLVIAQYLVVYSKNTNTCTEEHMVIF